MRGPRMVRAECTCDFADGNAPLRSDPTVQTQHGKDEKRNSKEIISQQFKATAQRVTEKRKSAYSIDGDTHHDSIAAPTERVSGSHLPPVMTKQPATNMRMSRGYMRGMTWTRTHSQDEVRDRAQLGYALVKKSLVECLYPCIPSYS